VVLPWPFLDFDPSRLKAYYDEKFEKGKVMAKEMKEKQERVNKMHEEAEIVERAKRREEEERRSNPEPMPTPTVSETPAEKPTKKVRSTVEQLKALADLHYDGVITKEEFEIMKKKVIAADID